LAGSNGTVPLPFRKIAKVGVALALIVVATVGPMADVHSPELGLVSHNVMLSGSVAFPVSTDAIISALAPTFTVATANAPAPLAPRMSTIPLLPAVAPRATISGTDVFDADISKVLSPSTIGATLAFAQKNENVT